MTESWYSTEDIRISYDKIDEKVTEWHGEAQVTRREDGGITSMLRRFLGGGGEPQERFSVKEKDAPRLYIVDDPSGPIYFELTEVEGGGTMIRVTFSSAVKERMARFRAQLPLKVLESKRT